MRIVYFGTYDLGKPRNALMIAALRQGGHEVIEIHAPLWSGVEDKSQVGKLSALWFASKWILLLPVLLVRYGFAPKHDVAIVGYLGIFELFPLKLMARLRGVPVFWDAFLSLYDTVVRDRQRLAATHPAARLLHWIERSACRAADCVLLDTAAHIDLFKGHYGNDRIAYGAVPVGADLTTFPRVAEAPKPGRVLFYGQLIPLHGLSTILAAAKRAPDLEWHLIGSGQQEDLLRQQSALPNLLWDRWVPYDQLTNAIADAGVCLGVFGMSEKAGAVIPNKVYQILASGRALVTRDGPGIRELVTGGEPGIRLVPPGDPDALVAAVRELLVSGEVPPDSYADRVGPDAILAALESILDGVVEAKASQARRR